MRTERTTTTGATGRGRAALAVVAGVVLAVATGAGAAMADPSPPSGPPTTDGPTAARLGAAWIATQVDAGLPLQVFGGDDWGATADAGLALAATGVDLPGAHAVWAAIESHRDAAIAPDDGSGGPGPFPDDPGAIAKVILLAHALGEDPHAVGAAPGADLVVRLQGSIRASGPDAGLYGSKSPTFDGSYRQGLALQALVAVGVNPDPAAVAWLLTQQCPNGAWAAYRVDPAAPCPTDGFGVSPETNGTGAAVTGLSALGGQDAVVAAALDWLAGVRLDDGGWGFGPGGSSDPNSTAGVLQALVTAQASGQERFAGALTALLSFQLGCDSPAADRGSFTFPETGGAANLFASVQAVPAALGVPAPLGGVEGIATPTVDCTTTTTTSTTTTSTTSTSTTSTSTTTTTDPVTTTTAPAEVLGATQGSSGSSGSTGGSSSGSSLALTGGDPAPLAAGGAALLLAGAALLLASRRRGATS